MFKHFKRNLIYEKKERNEQNRKAGRIARKKNTNLGRKIINKEINLSYPTSALCSTFCFFIPIQF